MQVATITMPREKARAAFEAYSAAVKKKYDADYEALAKGYKATTQAATAKGRG